MRNRHGDLRTMVKIDSYEETRTYHLTAKLRLNAPCGTRSAGIGLHGRFRELREPRYRILPHPRHAPDGGRKQTDKHMGKHLPPQNGYLGILRQGRPECQ